MNSPCPPSPTFDDTGFLDAFESLAIPPDNFQHADHLRAAWCCFRSSVDFASGAARFVHHFRRYIRQIGAEAKYHETITWFYLTVVYQRIAKSPGAGWEEFHAGNPDLFARGMPLLKASYQSETLESPLARRVFMLPDVPTS